MRVWYYIIIGKEATAVPNSEAFRPKKGDLLAVAFVLLLAAVLAVLPLLSAAEEERAVVRVYLDGALLYELPLDTDGTYTVSGAYENTITVSGGRVAITHATCPGQDCVRTGWVRKSGRTIVCLPNRLELRLVGASGVDIVAE